MLISNPTEPANAAIGLGRPTPDSLVVPERPTEPPARPAAGPTCRKQLGSRERWQLPRRDEARNPRLAGPIGDFNMSIPLSADRPRARASQS